jgi:hypothetical protein
VNHPVVGLYLAGQDAAVALGYGVVYSLPEIGWVPFFRWMIRVGLPHFADTSFGCVAIALRRPTTGLPRRLSAAPVTGFGREFADLWESAKAAIPITCGVVRTPDWVRYKNGGHLCLAVRDPAVGSLAGYVAVHRKSKLLVDILARTPEELGWVLAVAAGWLADHPGALGDGGEMIKAMETPELRLALEGVGATAVDYRFALVCHVLDPRLPSEDELLSRWYATPGD